MEVDTQTGGSDDSVQVVLIGSTGSGKSCTGNTILGNKRFPSDATAKSVTLKYQSVTEMIHGRRVTVVDTPGWDCTELHKDEVEAEIREALKNLRGPYSLLLVLRIGPVESEDIDKINRLQQVLGSSFLDHTTILFSHSDNLEQKTFQEFLDEGGPQFQGLLKSCGNRRHSWNNRDRRSDEEVEKVLRDLKMTEKEDQHQARSSEEPVHENRAEQKGNCGKGSDTETEMETEDAHNSKIPIRVVFLGMNKTGKTSSIKTLQARCERTEAEGVYSYSPAGLLLQLIDSPGFDQKPKEVQELISESKPHVIVIVMEVERFTSAVKKTMQDLQDCLGPKATKHTMILFTRKDDLRGAPIENFIKENAELNSVVEVNGRRFHALNNRDNSDHRQVEELLQKIANLYKGNKGVTFRSVVAADTQMRETEDLVQGSAQRSERLINQNSGEQKIKSGKRRRETDTGAMDAQNSKKPIQVLFLGMAKSGKTSSIKTLQARCDQTEDEGVYSYSSLGLLLQLIDSPALDQNPNMIQEQISKSEPHVIVIVMDVECFSATVQMIMSDFKNFQKLNSCAVILFTGKDNLEGASIDNIIKQNEGLKKIVEASGGRFHTLSNQNNSDPKQVEELLQKIADIHQANKGWLNKACSLL